jgi:hypothetical protein
MPDDDAIGGVHDDGIGVEVLVAARVSNLTHTTTGWRLESQAWCLLQHCLMNICEVAM